MHSLERITVTFLFGVPLAATYFIFALILCGFKDKIAKKPLLIMIFIQALIDAFSTIFLKDKYGIDTSFVYLLSGTIIMVSFLGIDLFSSLINNIISLIITFIIFQLPLSIVFAIICGISYDQLTILIATSNLYYILCGYTTFLLTLPILILVYKKNIRFIDLEKHKIFDKLYKSEKLNNGLTLLLILLTPVIISLALNFMVFYFYKFNQGDASSFAYLLINLISVILSSSLMLYLFNKIIKLRHYKIEWESQQKYLHDIDELLKNLRAQKHDFINHLNNINALLTVKDYGAARDYLQNIHAIIEMNNFVISTGDPMLNALLNVKAKTAENNSIKFVVTIDADLTDYNLKTFEISVALANIIDNAFEATNQLDEGDREVKIHIYSNGQWYIFDIENSGKTIPPHIINKVFEEGFTTKKHENGDHGFGLHISKTVIDYNKGKITVVSKNNITKFQIFIPKVNKNVKKRSVG